MPINTDILDLVQSGAALVNPTSAVSQATTTATTSAISSIKEGLGIAGDTTTSNDPSAQNTLRGKYQAALNEASAPRSIMYPSEVQEMISGRQTMIASFENELAEINAGNTSSLDGFTSQGIGVGDTETYDSAARKTYLEGRIASLQSEVAAYQGAYNGPSTPVNRLPSWAAGDAAFYADQVKDRERSAAGVENLADQLGVFQAHTDNLLGNSVNLSGLSKAADVARTVAGAQRNCGDLLGAVGSLTGGADLINGALEALGDIGALLEDVNSVLIKVNQTKAQLEGLINSDNLKLETMVQGAKDAMTAAVLSEINRDPCASFLFNDVLGTPQLKNLLG